MEHPMKGLFAQAGVSRQFFETDFGVDEVAQSGSAPAVSPSRSISIAPAQNSRANLRSRFIRPMTVSL
jgi:hypothetical protein